MGAPYVFLNSEGQVTIQSKAIGDTIDSLQFVIEFFWRSPELWEFLRDFCHCEADSIDNVGKDSNTNELNNHDQEHFILVLRSYVTKAYSDHDGGSPIDTVKVLNVPLSWVNLYRTRPGHLRITNKARWKEQQAESMGN